MTETEAEFPCSLVLNIPFPNHRLASVCLRSLQVDAEISPLVRRTFSLTSSGAAAATSGAHVSTSSMTISPPLQESETILCTTYCATTNRMLRVAVNGFMESLGVVLQVMEELDVDVLEPKP